MIEDLSSENLLVPCWFLFHINGFVFGIFHPAWDTFHQIFFSFHFFLHLAVTA